MQTIRRTLFRTVIASILAVLLTGAAYGTILPGIPDTYTKESMPDFGQHSVNWCWAAAAANSFWWYAQNGYPELLDDPGLPAGNQAYKAIDPLSQPPAGPPWQDTDAAGYRRLLRELAIDGGRVFSQSNSNDGIANMLQKFINDQGVGLGSTTHPNSYLTVHELVDPAFAIPIDRFGPGTFINPDDMFEDYGDPAPIVHLNPLVAQTVKSPTLADIARELSRSQDVLLGVIWKKADGTFDGGHVVTVVDYDLVNNKLSISDPYTDAGGTYAAGPSHRNSELHPAGQYDIWNVTSAIGQPLTVQVPATGNNRAHPVMKMWFVSPVPEPSTLLILGSGLIGLVGFMRKKK